MSKKEKMNRKSNNKHFFFVSEELIQEIFADVGQYNLFSNYIQKKTPQKGELLLLLLLFSMKSIPKKSFLNEINS